VLIASHAHAGKAEFDIYQAGDMDSKVSSRVIVLMEGKRALLEQLSN
jgi:hypothetical protein